MPVASGVSIKELVDQLNPEQRRAVLHRGGPVLVLAGAGTGKTRVITVRIAHMVAEGLDPERVLALTFTNKAAGEMAERVAGFVGKDAARAMTVGTFHSLGLQVVEADAKRLGFTRGVNLIDAAEQASAVRQCLKQLRIDPKRHDPGMFLTAISNARNAGITPDRMSRMLGKKLTASVYRAYLEWLRAYQAMDFDDLILRAVQLFEEHPDVRDRWRKKFGTILVDEYQDTNLCQLKLMRILADEHRSLCVVGDDDQSIYAWRGADITNILEFERHFSDATAIALTQNYRSTGHILSAANAVISNNFDRRDKSLWTDVGEGEQLRLATCRDPGAEARFVADEILRLRSQHGVMLGEIGVLFRTSAQAGPIEEAFRQRQIPYRLVGAFEFYERKEVRDTLSYLRLIVNPYDEVSLLRIINFPQRGVGPKTLEALRDTASATKTPLFSLLDAADCIDGIAASTAAKLARLKDFIDEARARYAAEPAIAPLVEWLCEASGAREAWIRDPTEGPGGTRRWKTIEYLIRSIGRTEERLVGIDLKGWLRLVALDGRSTVEDEEAAAAEEVALQTLHSSKGLEWPVCFLIGCQEGIIPHQRTLDTPRGDVSEERRLFYVGVTRARRIAYLTRSETKRNYRGLEETKPSRFLGEIPAGDYTLVSGDDLEGNVSDDDKQQQLARLRELRARIAGKS